MTTTNINVLRKEIEKTGEVTFSSVTFDANQDTTASPESKSHAIVKIGVDDLMRLIEDWVNKGL